MSTEASKQVYWAFISYSSIDADEARRLHRWLESYRIPRDLVGRPGRDEPVPGRIFPIFRDRDELPVSADLGSSIEGTLRASRYLIVLCSPDSAKSRWVNEEIRYFKSLGREDRVLAIILRGEPNASEVPGRESEECFGPALRHRITADGRLTDERTEPIAGDLRKGGDGRRNAFLKAVAGITGLGFDAFANRQAKRDRRKRLLAAASLVTLLIGGLWTWDYNRLKVAYYANTTTRWGVPEGVGPLSSELRAGRETHYRFESRRGKVRAVLRMNSVGELRDDPEAHDASQIRVLYLSSGDLQSLEYRDRHGQVKTRHMFGTRTTNTDGAITQVITFQDARGGARTQEDVFGSLVEDMLAGPAFYDSRSDITGQSVVYDAGGRTVAVAYLNAYGFPRANARGIYGQRFTYGPLGVPTRIEYSDIHGKPVTDHLGIAGRNQSIGVLGDKEGEEFVTLAGSPARDASGVSSFVRALDGHGNITSVRYLGADGQPTTHKDGYARFTQAYDERGNLIEQAYFGADGQPTTHKNGYARVTWAHDERGNRIEWAYFGTDGQPTTHKDGYARFTQAHDERGNRIEQAYFGTDRQPVGVRGSEVHRTVWIYDDRGDQVGRRSYRTDGTLIAE